MVNQGGTEGQLPRRYLQWNDKLAAAVFRHDMAGREVLLCITDEMIDAIGGKDSEADFVEAVNQGPPWAEASLGLCQNALKTLDDWRSRDLRFPPYIGYLALFVLAVGLPGDFAPNEYYARLRTLLRWPNPDAGTVPSFQHMHRLWEDLEIWSQEDMDGELGVFNVRLAGKWAHVGLPKAQAVFTEAELRALPVIFAAAALDPTSIPPSRELARTIRQYGAQALRSRTLELLGDRPSDSQLSSMLIDTVRTELEEWDGTIATPAIDPTGAYNQRATIRICVRIDEIARTARFRFRVRTKTDMPEDGLQLRSETDGRKLLCQESELPGWSRNLTDGANGQDIDAASFDWSNSQIFDDAAEGWRVTRPGNRVKIFAQGASVGLAGYVEVRELEHNTPFLLAAPASAVAHLDAWRNSGEVDLVSVDVTGLPPRWILFRSAGASSDRAIAKAIPELSLPSIRRLRLEGGIRSGRQNTAYFDFARPLIVIEGATGEELVVCDDAVLEPTCWRANAFELPPNLPTGTRINIEAIADGDKIRRQSLYLTGNQDSLLLQPLVCRDALGIPCDTDDQSKAVAGVLSDDIDTVAYPIRLSFDSHHRRFLIGRRPGEIIKIFDGIADIPWRPIWIVELANRRGRAVYSGLDIAQEYPLLDPVMDPDSVDLWKEILFYNRGKIREPGHPRAATLWKRYVSVASKTKKGRHVKSR